MRKIRKLEFFIIFFIFIFDCIILFNSFYPIYSRFPGSSNELELKYTYTLNPYIIWDNSPLTILGQEDSTNIDAVRFGDITGDDIPEVIATLNSTIDYLMVFNSTDGNQLWNISSKGLVSAFDPEFTPGKSEGFLFVTDILGDSVNEVLIPHISDNESVYTRKKANITAIDTLTQSALWSADIWEYGKYQIPFLGNWTGPDEIESAAIGDVNNDGKSEIVVGVPGTQIVAGVNEIFMIDTTDGSLLWEAETPKGSECEFLAMGDLDNDDDDEVIAIEDETVIALEGTNGNIIWNYTLPENAYSVAVGDINADSYEDVLIGFWNYFEDDIAITAINGSNGITLWNFTPLESNNYFIELKIRDLNSDFMPEIIAGSTKKLFVLNCTGDEIWNKSAYVNTISIANFDGDTNLDVAYGADGYWVYAFNGLNGSTIFEKKLSSFPDSQYYQIDSADFNDDNYAELIVSNFADELIMIKQNIYPDLVITPSDITFSPTVPYQGQNTTINFTILNSGNENVTNCRISVFHDNQSIINLIENKTINVNIYNPIQYSVSWNTSGYKGYHDIIINVDPDNQILESNESNNLAVKNLFIMHSSLGPNIQLISPLNTTYNVPDIPVNITNSTEVHSAWFCYSTNGGGSWRGNFSLIYDGGSIINYTTWINNNYSIKIYANNSYGKISLLQAYFKIEIVQNNYKTDFLITPPTIDGVLSSNEWGKITFNRTVQNEDANFYLKTNSSYLFLACEYFADTIQNNWDVFTITIDEDHDHILSSGREYKFSIYGDGLFYYYQWSDPIWYSVTKPEGFSAMINYSSGHAIYEMKVPLDFIDVCSGEIIGMSIYLNNYVKNFYVDWPIETDFNDPSTWGNLELCGYFDIHSPNNITYNNNLISIIVENSSFIHKIWYRNNTGLGWSKNSTLNWNGSHFINNSILYWVDGTYYLQIFANNSIGEIYQVIKWFTIDTLVPPSISIISPENISYMNENLSIFISNSSEVANCWYRFSSDGGSSWSSNTTLIYNGINFTNSTILTWQEGTYYLQVFANNSFGKVSIKEIWFSITLPSYDFIYISDISPNPSNGFTEFIVINSSILNINGIVANITGPNEYFIYCNMSYEGANRWIFNFTIYETGIYTIKINATSILGIICYDMAILEGDIEEPILNITISHSNGIIIIKVFNTTEFVSFVKVNISGPSGFFRYLDLIYIGENQWMGNFTPNNDGNYTIYVNGSDLAGNMGYNTESIEYSITKPFNWLLIIILGIVISAIAVSIAVIMIKRSRKKESSKKSQNLKSSKN